LTTGPWSEVKEEDLKRKFETMAGLVTYRKFRDLAEAEELLELLETNGLAYVVVNNSPSFDVTFSLSRVDDQVEIQLKPSDFPVLDGLLAKKTEQELPEIDPEHYLFTFTSEELLDVIAKPGEWTVEDRVLAKKILSNRGVHLTEQRVKEMEERYLQAVHLPERAGTGLVLTGLIFSGIGGFIPIFTQNIFSRVFEFLGLTIGVSLVLFKKTDSEGKRFPVFSRKARLSGAIMIMLALLSHVAGYYYMLNGF
jgi:hypothetical protein